MKKCENCSSLNNGEYGSGRFCSSKCARGFSTKNNREEIYKKVSSSLVGNIPWNKGKGENISVSVERKCFGCGDLFHAKRKLHIFCSRICQMKYKGPEQKLKQSLAMKEKVKDGTHSGWQSRKIRSYAEKFFEEVLNNNNIKEYKTEENIKKKDLGINCNSHYFLDFYFSKLKLDLEIDGKQHEIKERKESDQIRDKLLNEKLGIKVYRIKWKNINNEKGKIYIKNEIEKFLIYYGRLV